MIWLLIILAVALIGPFLNIGVIGGAGYVHGDLRHGFLRFAFLWPICLLRGHSWFWIYNFSVNGHAFQHWGCRRCGKSGFGSKGHRPPKTLDLNERVERPDLGMVV